MILPDYKIRILNYIYTVYTSLACVANLLGFLSMEPGKRDMEN